MNKKGIVVIEIVVALVVVWFTTLMSVQHGAEIHEQGQRALIRSTMTLTGIHGRED